MGTSSPDTLNVGCRDDWEITVQMVSGKYIFYLYMCVCVCVCVIPGGGDIFDSRICFETLGLVSSTVGFAVATKKLK